MATKPTSGKQTSKSTPHKPRGIAPREKRTRWAVPVSQPIERLTKGLLGRQGFAQGAIVTKWPEIVGDTMAQHTQPEKIIFSRDGVSGGTLHLKTDSGAYAMEIQHQEPQVIERINTFFGYRAIERIKLIQGPIPQNARPRHSPPRRPNTMDTKDSLMIQSTVNNIEDQDLKEALERLGQSVFGRNKTKT